MRIDLPSGGWAEFRDPTTLTERQCRPVREAFRRYTDALINVSVFGPDGALVTEGKQATKAWALMPAEDKAIVNTSNDLMVLALVMAWSFEAPIDAEALLDLVATDYARLRSEAAKLREFFEPLDTTVSVEPDSPTAPLSA